MNSEKNNSENNIEIRIYVACLAAYNNGILHGAWIDADQDPFDIWNEVSAMLIASPIENAEEWAIHDYEGFEGYSLSEYEGFDEVSKIAAFISEYGALCVVPSKSNAESLRHQMLDQLSLHPNLACVKSTITLSIFL